MTGLPRMVVYAALGGAIVLPIIFRGRAWLRLASVLLILAAAGLGWGGIQTSSRLASEEARMRGDKELECFDRAAVATRMIAQRNLPILGASLLGLAILALIPGRERKTQPDPSSP